MPEPTIWSWLVFRQDYAWLLVLVGWTALLFAWWRSRTRNVALAWLPWSAAGGALTGALELSQLVTPLKVEMGATWLAWDVALGGVAAGLAGSWCWAAAGHERHGWRRLLIQVAVLGVLAWAGARIWQPDLGAAVICGSVTCAAFVLIRRAGSGVERVAIAAVVAAQWLSTFGIVAELIEEAQRFTGVSSLGPVAAGLQVVAITFSALALGRERQLSLVKSRAGQRRVVATVGVWLAAGLLVMESMGYWARRAFERDVLARAEMSAALLDRAATARVLRTLSFRRYLAYTQNGRSALCARIEELPAPDLDVLTRAIDRLASANPDATEVVLVSFHGPWLFNFGPTSKFIGSTRFAGLYGNVGAADRVRWAKAAPEMLGPVRVYHGELVQARAPLFDPEGRMIGWVALDFPANVWLAAQVQPRLLAALAVVLSALAYVLNVRQRERERERAAAERDAAAAAESTRLKTEFLAKVSHELRTPLQTVLGYTELLRPAVQGTKAVSWLDSLRQHSELMTRLVNDLIDLSAIENGAFTLTERVVSPGDIIAQTVESFRPQAEARGLALACILDTGLPAHVGADAERLRQVALNLIGNAIKFTDTGGVTVALRVTPLPAGEVTIALRVRDTGPGISAEGQKRLFVPFSRLSETANREGSGLGLALSAALCRRMGGELKVESDGASGSCFTASFRARITPDALTPREPARQRTLRGRHVLVVDDNAYVRELFVAYLTEQGAVCANAADAAEAWHHLEQERFDAVVLDLSLPGADGVEIARRWRQRPNSPALRIVGVSAHANARDRARAMQAGMDAFLVKPVSLPELGVAIAAETSVRAAAMDTSALEALRKRLTHDFVHELPMRRRELDEAIGQRDWPRVRALSHHLKNSAAVIADDQLLDACIGMEASADAGDGAAVLQHWPRCAQAIARWA